MLTGLIPHRSVHQWLHLLAPRPLSITTTFCGVPIPSPSPCAACRDLNVPQLSHLDVGDSGGKEGQRISDAKSKYRSTPEPSFTDIQTQSLLSDLEGPSRVVTDG